MTNIIIKVKPDFRSAAQEKARPADGQISAGQGQRMPLNLCRALRGPETFGSGKISPFLQALLPTGVWRPDFRAGRRRRSFPACVGTTRGEGGPLGTVGMVVFHRRFRGGGTAVGPFHADTSGNAAAARNHPMRIKDVSGPKRLTWKGPQPSLASMDRLRFLNRRGAVDGRYSDRARQA